MYVCVSLVGVIMFGYDGIPYLVTPSRKKCCPARDPHGWGLEVEPTPGEPKTNP